MKETSDYAKMSNENVLFILDRHTTMAPYSHEFVKGGADPQMLSGFVGAMSNFMEEMTGSEEIHWKTQYGSDSTFLVEGGEWTLGVLSVLRETSEVRSKLRRVVLEFEDCFAALKGAEAIEGAAFKEFDSFVRRVFIDDRLTSDSLILKGSDWRVVGDPYETPSQAFYASKFLIFTNSDDTIGQTAANQEISIDKARELASQALWHHSIFIKYIPSENDILSLSMDSASVILGKGNPLKLSPRTVRVVAALDGRTPLAELTQEFDLNDSQNTYSELGGLNNLGYIHKISIEQNHVLVNECILSHILNQSTTAIGRHQTIDFITSAQDIGIVDHPWVGRIKITEDL
ncbi:MAG: hypothetical protein ACTSQZ_00070, partial [Candidatus Thorarchaeota archaeon]